MPRKSNKEEPAQEDMAASSPVSAKPALTGNLAVDVYNELIADLGKERADKIMRDIAEYKMRTTLISTRKH